MPEDTDYGNDIDCLTDLAVTMRTITGREAVAQVAARRLQTPRGSLFYDTDFGYDLRRFVSGIEPDIGSVEGSIVNEVIKDERVEDADATVVFDTPNKKMTVKLILIDSLGPFELVLNIDEVTVEILRGPI